MCDWLFGYCWWFEGDWWSTNGWLSGSDWWSGAAGALLGAAIGSFVPLLWLRWIRKIECKSGIDAMHAEFHLC
jgi:hypothetical protein